ncbi:MAG: hypothetical protein IKE42_05570 [Aquamicrobium sp.]|jgi:ethanolamine utilization protein EutQ|uniref:cupin n=1 Tax=Mesorhizobium sp. Pch-S TaxID=2082387 RepID=UPI0010112FF6|nr:cupin [Mesorhizobium sp. Pch-S]MBR2687300.1 hypothetical protein [Aquamicrobium sp.]QAZ45018.1 cupin [Mesorhizobium sp. Pch-S]
MDNPAQNAGSAPVRVAKFNISDAPLSKLYPEKTIELGDVIDRRSGGTISIGYARYKSGEANDWKVTYDEALVITKGNFTVVYDGEDYTAALGEVIYLKKDTTIFYRANTDVELVYVTYPHWRP